MKKKLKMSEDSVDYEVGLVSGSLSKSGSGPGSSSLSALFSSTTSAPSSALFQPAPEIVKSAEPKEKPKEHPEVKVQNQKKVQLKETSAASLSVQTREQSLSAADEEEQVSGKTRKRKSSSHVVDLDQVRGVEYWVKRRQTLKTNRLQDQEKNQRTVFVGNLPLSATKKTLRTLFKDQGPIESIRFRSLVREDPSMSRRAAAIMLVQPELTQDYTRRKAHPQKQSINAYVVFKDEESASRALDRNGLELEQDLFIRVDRVKDSASHDHKRSVFVGNLPFDLKEASLRRHFSECGSVEAVRLIRDQRSGLGKGFGYVLFQSADSVQLALKLNGSELEGRLIRIKRSVQTDKIKLQTKELTKTKRTRGRNQTHPTAQTRNKVGSKPGSNAGFRGEVAAPRKKVKKMGLKKQKAKKNKKTAHLKK